MKWLENKYLNMSYKTYGIIKVFDKMEDEILAVIKVNNSSLRLIKPSNICSLLRKRGFKFDDYDKKFNYYSVLSNSIKTNNIYENNDIPEWYIPGDFFDVMNSIYITLYDYSYEFGFDEKWDTIFSK
jgi:hypothetical protein